MTDSTAGVFVVIASLSFLVGCSSVPNGAGFDDVRMAVADRTGQDVRWNRESEADREAAKAVHRLLSKELTVDDAVRVALLDNQGLQATYEELGIAQAEVVEAGLLRNPSLGFDLRFPRFQSPLLPYDVEVTQSFLELLTMPLRKRAAGAALSAAKQRVTNEVLKTVADVEVAFYRAQGGEQLADLRRSVLAATAASYDAARRLHDAGNITDLTLADERAMYEQSKIEAARAERNSLDAREELNALMGAWGADAGAWKITPRLPALPEEEIDPNRLESLAVSRRSDLGAARQEVEVAAQSLGLTRYTALFPNLSAGANVQQDADGEFTAGPSLQIPIPLFNQGQPAVAAAVARFRQSRRRYAALAVEVRAEVRRARNDWLAARNLAEYYGRVIVPLRHQIVEQSQLQFNAMQIGIFELLQSKQAEIDAGREYVGALEDYWVAQAELERAVGGRVEATVPAGIATVGAESTTQPWEQAEQEHHHHGE